MKHYYTGQEVDPFPASSYRMQCERLKAADYYGNKAPGWVVLANGQPTHYTGPDAAKESAARMRRLKSMQVT